MILGQYILVDVNEVVDKCYVHKIVDDHLLVIAVYPLYMCKKIVKK